MPLLKDVFLTEFPKEYLDIQKRIEEARPLTLRQSKLMLYMVEYLKGREAILENTIKAMREGSV